LQGVVQALVNRAEVVAVAKWVRRPYSGGGALGVGAVCGQIAGAWFGEEEIPEASGLWQPGREQLVSDLLNGRVSGFSLERLVRFLNARDRDVEIVVRRGARSRGRAGVRVRVSG